MKVLLLVVDSLRADAPGFGGGEATPTLDHLAHEGVSSTELCVSGAWTIPSLLSMLTGALPHHLGLARWRHPYPAGQPNLFTAFAAAGFQVEVFVPHPQWGLLTVPGIDRRGSSQAPEAVAAALRRSGGDQLFFIHHWWTHLPYLNREMSPVAWFSACDYQLRSLGRYPRLASRLEASYRAAVRHFSEELLPRYLEALGAGGEDALVVITGDHGESWGAALPPDRRVTSVYDLHGRWITDETILVPLLAQGALAEGTLRRDQSLTKGLRGVDLAPTIAALAGVPWPGPAPSPAPPAVVASPSCAECVGRSFAGALVEGGDDRLGDRELMTITSHNAHQPRTFPDHGPALFRTLAVRNAERWLIWDGVGQRRWVAGPDQPTAMLAAGADQELDRAATRLEAERLRARDPGAPLTDDEVSRVLNDGALDHRLRSLGYLD